MSTNALAAAQASRANPKILVCGMPRSMTTWAFNVMRELIAHPTIDYIWIAPKTLQEAQFTASQSLVLAKCHHFTQSIAEAADVVIYSYRDLRSAAVSYHRKFDSPCTREMVDNWVEAEKKWLAFSDIVLRYEDVERDPVKAAGALRALLECKAPQLSLSTLNDTQVVAQVDKHFRATQDASEVTYDSVTMILPGHRTFQPAPAELMAEEKAIYDRVEADFSAWLSSHRYVEPSDLGQELEYRVARTFLSAFDKPIVIDVGVERGSFIDLALSAGSSRVIGFEPLPRHVAHLGRRYSTDPRVHIHPWAISNSIGTAQLHVAIDPEGNELDYHHSLDELGDSATVIRSRRTLEVKTATLGNLAYEGLLPSRVDFLKIDTDGHDLAVLEGLGDLRPEVIMAEYWDTLPESSGRNPFTLADLSTWAKSNGYRHMLSVRRHGRIELVQWNSPWTIAGDWGNVFFISATFDFGRVEQEIHEHALQSYESLSRYVAALMRETEEKEAEIRTLAAALQETRGQLSSGGSAVEKTQDIRAPLVAPPSTIQGLPVETVHSDGTRRLALDGTLEEKPAKHVATMLASLEVNSLLVKGLEEKEAVIQEMKKALIAYRSAFAVLGFFKRFTVRLFPLATLNRFIPRPRLGVLYQHEPQDLLIPGGYASHPVLAHTPEVSVVTPSFRQGAFIDRTMRSVLDQEYPNLEYYVQDGGSQDGTREIIERHADRLAGWESRPDEGQSQAINLAFARTSGEIMAWLNSDDILLPGALHCVADFFNRNPDVDVVYGHRLLIDENDRLIGRWILPAHDDNILSWADYVPQETLFWRRSIWEKVGGRIDESFRFAMDWDLLLRFRDAGARFARIPRFLGGFRIHPHQKTSAAIGEIGFKEMDRLRERSLGRLPTHAEIRLAVMPYLLRHMACDLEWRLPFRLRSHR